MRPSILVLCLLCLACDEEKDPAGAGPGDASLGDAGVLPTPTEYSADTFLRDADGRALILRGVNIAHTAKQAPDGIPWVDAKAVARLRKEFGFNAIRLTVFWNHVEPRRGEYAASYLEALRKILDWAFVNEQHVILDMHQDLFGFVSKDEGEGDGVPEWARKPDCPEFQDTDQWTDNYFTPCMRCQFEQFWNNERGVQDDFIAMWKHVVSELGHHQAVAGIDPFNEPWLATLSPKEALVPFYDKLIPVVREVVPGLVVFYEPGTLSGSVVDQSIPKPKFDNLVYAPHFYPSDIYGLRPGDTYNGSSASAPLNMTQAEDVNGEVSRLIGEFGISAGVNRADVYYRDLLALWGPSFVGFTVWSYDKSDDYPYVMLDGNGDPHAHTAALFEPFAERIPGTPKATSIDRTAGTLSLTADAEEGELVISCPARFCMTKREVTVKGAAVEGSYDATLGILRIPLSAGADTTVTLAYTP